jgi:hypothetical protein
MRRTFRVAGQRPRVKWKRNRNRTKRTIVQAIAIAERYGIWIPEDVEFAEARPGELKGRLEDLLGGGGMETARGPEVREQPDGYVYWRHHYTSSGKIRFRIHPETLMSDEAIVGTIAHELFELAELRAAFMSSKNRRMNGTDYGLQVAVDQRGNFHDQAWDAADRAVLRMRSAKK